MTVAEKIRRVDGLPFQMIGDQLLVVVASTREVHLMNATAGRVWELLDQPCTLAELTQRILEEYEVEPAGAQQEIDALVRDMCLKGMVEKVG